MPTANYKKQHVVLAKWNNERYSDAETYHYVGKYKSKRAANRVAKVWRNAIVVPLNTYKTTLMLLNE
jgi:hypothetical protein